MAGVSITVDLAGLARASGAVAALAQLDEDALLTAIGATGESQTRRRIEETKTSPDGDAWPANREGTSILLRTGEHLRDSIAYETGPGLVRWGSSWEFAGVHQHGATIVPKSGKSLAFVSGGRKRFAKKVTIPARPFVGASAADLAEIDEVVTDYLGTLAR